MSECSPGLKSQRTALAPERVCIDNGDGCPVVVGWIVCPALLPGFGITKVDATPLFLGEVPGWVERLVPILVRRVLSQCLDDVA